jgi:hypothetical protein
MGAKNECSAELDGRRAAVELAIATRPDDFTNKCWSIDQKLSSANSDYARSFMMAMNNELQDRNLLPKVELNMVAAGDTPAMQALQKNKHVETQDLVKDEDQLRSAGRNTEAMLMHRLGSNAQDIHDTHAERNFWGKNHGGIDMDRMHRWADQNKANLRGAIEDAHPFDDDADAPKVKLGANAFNHFYNPPSIFPDLAPRNQHKDDPRATDYDKKQDAEINRLSKETEEQKKRNHAQDLKEQVQAGVIKDAHHTVKHGETLYDMACLALHKAGRDHMTQQAIRFEEEKIRAINHLGAHEQLRSGQSLMLRTEQEVEHETARRIKLYEKSDS